MKMRNIVASHRKKQGLSLRGMAQKLGVSYQTIANWEAGSVPSGRSLDALVGHLFDHGWEHQLAQDVIRAGFPNLARALGLENSNQVLTTISRNM